MSRFDGCCRLNQFKVSIDREDDFLNADQAICITGLKIGDNLEITSFEDIIFRCTAFENGGVIALATEQCIVAVATDERIVINQMAYVRKNTFSFAMFGADALTSYPDRLRL